MSVPASPEQAMVRFELQTEFTSSILSTFAHTHGSVYHGFLCLDSLAVTCSR